MKVAIANWCGRGPSWRETLERWAESFFLQATYKHFFTVLTKRNKSKNFFVLFGEMKKKFTEL